MKPNSKWHFGWVTTARFAVDEKLVYRCYIAAGHNRHISGIPAGYRAIMIGFEPIY